MGTEQRAKVKKKAAKKVAKKAEKKVHKKVAKKVKKVAMAAATKANKPTKGGPVSRRKKAAKRAALVAITPVPSPALAIEPARAFSGARDKRPESVLAMSAQIISRHQEYARAATAQWWRLWTAPMRLAGRSHPYAHARKLEHDQNR